MKQFFIDTGIRDKVYRYLMQLSIVAFVCLWIKVTNVTIILILLYWITEPQLLSKIKTAFRSKFFWSIISLFLLHLLSLAYSHDLHTGLKQIETRVTLFVFPLVFITIRLTTYTFNTLLKTFIWACMAVSIIGLIYSNYLFLTAGESVYLYSDNLLLLIKGQAIYFALYLNAALLFVAYLYFTDSLVTKKYLYTYLVTPTLVLMIFLLASRISLMVLVLLFILLVVVIIIKNKKYKLGLALISCFAIGILLLAALFPKTINRFKSLTYYHFDYKDATQVYHFNEEEFENRWNGLTIRLAIWSCTWDAIKDNPIIGTGIGDYMHDLREAYQEKEFKLGLINDYSPHNQYLQIILSLGVVGFLAFMWGLLFPLREAHNQLNYLYLFFTILILMNMITEDIWGAFRGVVFFSFFNSLLFFQKPTDKNH